MWFCAFCEVEQEDDIEPSIISGEEVCPDCDRNDDDLLFNDEPSYELDEFDEEEEDEDSYD